MSICRVAMVWNVIVAALIVRRQVQMTTESQIPWRPGVIIGDRGTKVADIVRTLSTAVDSVPVAVLDIVASYVPPLRVPWRALVERKSSLIVSIDIPFFAALTVEYKMPSRDHTDGSVHIQLFLDDPPDGVMNRTWSIFGWIHTTFVKRHLQSDKTAALYDRINAMSVYTQIYSYGDESAPAATVTAVGASHIAVTHEAPLPANHVSIDSLLPTPCDHGYDVVTDDTPPSASTPTPPKSADAERLDRIREMHARRVAQWLNAIPSAVLVVRSPDSPYLYDDDISLYDL